MNILFLGINHFDLLGALKIKECLEIQKQAGREFDCVCIEWDETVAETLIGRRDDLKKRIIEKYTDKISGRTIELISEALAYEADAYKRVYEIAEVCWLDNGRRPDSFDRYIEDRLTIYTWHSMTYSIDIDDVEHMSQHLWDISTGDADLWTDSARDEFLYYGIESAVKGGKENILVIVGEKHANLKRSCSTASLLLKNGYTVESIILSPTPRTVDPTTTSTDV